jgi:bifunctional oligoribonuclease and PAP phosphatase NrnA
MDPELNAAIKARFSTANNILVVSHIRPDGDAIGSLLALGLALQQSGKTVQMVLTDGVPASFRHLVGHEQVRREVQGDVDLFVTVDCADFKRTGKQFETSGRKPDINIDHHLTNERFGQLNLIEPEAVATAAILTDALPEWGLSITPPVAAALATGIVTDTLGFRTSNTTPAALRLVAALMEVGIDLPDLYNRALVSRSFTAARYWGAGLSNLKSEHGIVYATLTVAERKAVGYSGNDDSDLINVISSIEEHTVGMVFVEQDNQHVKISWRALQPGIDVSAVARHFNGGGHAAAAGADIAGTLEEIQPRVLKATREMLNQ